MTLVVTDKCIRCKYTDCVTVCPVDCFYKSRHMLVIAWDDRHSGHKGSRRSST